MIYVAQFQSLIPIVCRFTRKGPSASQENPLVVRFKRRAHADGGTLFIGQAALAADTARFEVEESMTKEEKFCKAV